MYEHLHGVVQVRMDELHEVVVRQDNIQRHLMQMDDEHQVYEVK